MGCLKRSATDSRHSFGLILGRGEPRLGSSSKCFFRHQFKVNERWERYGADWVEEHWVWDLRWRMSLFVWELDLLNTLLATLNGSLIYVVEDS
ncbi:hypothetical protein A2U01_0029796 [Trifolium medium]|uniref:Uncharacterized protein n=1 Tax=Trifolium medium TaxID=97028 RepID=A0A392PAI6_9FABA|nr:hypothetical protein [Trifolium medium]